MTTDTASTPLAQSTGEPVKLASMNFEAIGTVADGGEIIGRYTLADLNLLADELGIDSHEIVIRGVIDAQWFIRSNPRCSVCKREGLRFALRGRYENTSLGGTATYSCGHTIGK